MRPLSGRRALVTGSARGIGFAIARRLLEDGARVALCDIDSEALAEARKGLESDSVLIHACDITDPGCIESLRCEVESRFGGLDILVNNAAILDWTPVDKLTERRLDEVWRVNFLGALRCIQTFLPALQKSCSGRVINIASIMGIRGAANSVAYNSAKAALINLTRCLAVDLAPQGVLINAVAPGFIDTRMSRLSDGTSEYQTDWFKEVYLKHHRLPLGRPGTAQEVAGPVAFLCSADAAYINGQVLVVDGGVTCTF